MKAREIADHISAWLTSYCDTAGLSGFVIGISGGVDSALTSTLCAMTGKKVIAVSMPIRQTAQEYKRAKNHIEALQSNFSNITSFDIELTDLFAELEKAMPFSVEKEHLAMVNSRARLRMTTLYALGQANNCLVAGTGNKVEDFGIGFYTKYGDGGVDISPLGDLTKTEVWEIAREINVIKEIVDAIPTDGLWEDGRSDEDQIGASYPELEWAMDFKGDENDLGQRQIEVLDIYRKLHAVNKHKMTTIPVCYIPEELK